MSRGMAWTIQTDSLELWWDLVLHGMGEVDFHDFRHSWKVPSSPNDSWASRWVLGFVSRHQRLLVERPSAKIHFEERPPKKEKLWELGQPLNIVIIRSTREYHGNISFCPVFIFHGLSIDFPWIFHGFPWIFPWFSMVFP